MKTIKPRKNTLVIIPPVKEREKKTAGGIILQGKDIEEPPLIAEVIAIGEGIDDIKVGDKIVYRRYRDHRIEVDGRQLAVIEDVAENVFGIIEE